MFSFLCNLEILCVSFKSSYHSMRGFIFNLHCLVNTHCLSNLPCTQPFQIKLKCVILSYKLWLSQGNTLKKHLLWAYITSGTYHNSLIWRGKLNVWGIEMRSDWDNVLDIVTFWSINWAKIKALRKGIFIVQIIISFII